MQHLQPPRPAPQHATAWIEHRQRQKGICKVKAYRYETYIIISHLIVNAAIGS